MELLTSSEVWISLLTLTAMEIVLGIDNIVFISILAGKLPAEVQGRARTQGLALAMITRLLLLFSISGVMKLTEPLFSVGEFSFSGKSLILLIGGLFLVAKATREIHEKLEVDHHEAGSSRAAAGYGAVLLQIMLLDVVFSLDSVITAVGMARHLSIMVAAMVISVGVMLLFAGRISDFVNRHPSMKILALSFLILIGVMLVMEGMGHHVDKGYIYFAMAFSLVIEILNLRMRRKQIPVTLHHPFEGQAGAKG